jgi:hypothetical protein
MSVNRIFKKIPSDDLILKFFSIVGIRSFTNSAWFAKGIFTSQITTLFDNMLPELEPFYMDHKSFIIKREMNANRYVQILRHLAKVKGIYLESKSYGKQRGTYYRLHVIPNIQSEFLVIFT